VSPRSQDAQDAGAGRRGRRRDHGGRGVLPVSQVPAAHIQCVGHHPLGQMRDTGSGGALDSNLDSLGAEIKPNDLVALLRQVDAVVAWCSARSVGAGGGGSAQQAHAALLRTPTHLCRTPRPAQGP